MSLPRVPALAEVLQKLGGAISTDEMRKTELRGGWRAARQEKCRARVALKKGLIQ